MNAYWWSTEFQDLRRTNTRNEILIYVVSWLILSFISVSATLQIREVLRHRADDTLRRRANQIAIIAALVVIAVAEK